MQKKASKTANVNIPTLECPRPQPRILRSPPIEE